MTAAGSVLFVAADDDVMRLTFREYGRGHWSSEFPLILEKHGWLDFSVVRHEALSSPDALEGHALVIVAWLPEERWRPEYLETLRRYRGELLLEGPLPPAIEDFVGVTRDGDAVAGLQGDLTLSDSAAAYLEARFGSQFPVGHRSGPDPSLVLAPKGDPNPLQLAPRQSVTRSPGLSRDLFMDLEVEPLEQNLGKAGVSLVLAYAARFRQNERFFDDPLDDALALLACTRCLANVSGRGPLQVALRRLVIAAAGSNRRPPPTIDERAPAARAVWALALTEATAALEDETFAERAKDLLGDIQAEWLAPGSPDPVVSRWRALLALELTGPPEDAALAALEAFLPFVERPPVQSVWLDANLAAHVGSETVGVLGQAASRVTSIARSIDEAEESRVGGELDGLNVPDLMLMLACLRRLGHEAAARRLWRILLQELYDTRDGLFFNARVAGGALEPARGRSISPLVALGLLDAAGAVEILHPPTEALDEYTPEQRVAWAAPPYSFQPYAGVEPDEVVMALELPEGPPRPAIWRRGNVTATSFQLLAHLVHVHTVEPLAEPFSSFRSGDAIALEYLVVHLLGASLAREPQVVTVAPWPWGTAYVTTVRHDVDRLLDGKQFKRLFDFERSHDLAVSWFWLPGRLDEKQLARLEREPGHEIALHSVRLDQKQRELERVGRAVSDPIAGEAFHGSGDGWLGHLSVRSAVEAELLYTELAPPVADVPYARYPTLAPDGVVGADRIVGVTYNISIESKMGTKPGSEGGPGLYRQLLNHPDLNFDRLTNWVEALPQEPHLHWTCEQVARWWRATHAEGRLRIRHLDGAGPELRFEVEAADAIDDLELRLPCRPELVSGVLADGEPAEWSAFEEPEYAGIRIRLSLSPQTPVTVVVAGGGGAG